MVRNYAGFETGLWYDGETVEGVTDTTAPFLHLAHRTEVKLSDSPNPVVVAKSGSVDNSGISKGIENPVATFTFNPSQASGKDFIKNFASSTTSFTLLMMIDEASDVIFGRIVGCKVKRISCSVKIYPQGTALECSVEVWGMSILYTASAGVPTFESAPSTFVNWSDITLKKGAVTITNWWSCDWSLENDLFRNPDNTGITNSITKGRRKVSGSWEQGSNVTSGVGNTELDEAKNATANTFHFLILTDDYSFTSSVYETVEVTHPITEMTGIKGDFVATSYSVA